MLVRMLLLAVAMFVFACDEDGLGSDECTQAVEKLDDCGLTNQEPARCDTATDRCEANCINAHSCEQIQEALLGTPNAYSACDDAC
ncbi:MAG TPA: hypothetical protein VML75_18540 [Kofleriaceae bacterium]|nr:hypothetical protein [Kofleriaceae bacterium]